MTRGEDPDVHLRFPDQLAGDSDGRVEDGRALLFDLERRGGVEAQPEVDQPGGAS